MVGPVKVYNALTGALVSTEPYSGNSPLPYLGACSWAARTEAGTPSGVHLPSNILYKIDVSGGETGVLASYYWKICRSNTERSITCPVNASDFPDINVFFGTISNGVNTFAPGVYPNGMIANPVETYFPASEWVLPHDESRLCTLSGACGTTGVDNGVFFAPAPLTPGAGSGGPISITSAPSSEWVVPTGSLVNWLGADVSEVKFNTNSRLTVNGTLNAGNMKFTSKGAIFGWSGIRIQSGPIGLTGSNSHIWDSIIERVTGWGSQALRIDNNSSPLLESVTIQRNSTQPSAITGVVVSGSASHPHANQLKIDGMTYGGVVISGSSSFRIVGGTLTNNVGSGITAGSFSDVFLTATQSPNVNPKGVQVTANTGNGIYVGGDADVVLGNYFYSSGGLIPSDGYSTVSFNDGGGLVGTQWSTIYAGGSYLWRRNRILLNGQTASSVQASGAGAGSTVMVSCNYWGVGVQPPLPISSSGGATVTATTYLNQDPDVYPNAPCVSGLPPGGKKTGEAGAFASGDGGGVDNADRLMEAIESDPIQSFERLSAIALDDPRAPEASIAIIHIGRLASTREAPEGALEFLESAREGPLRLPALTALSGLWYSNGDTERALRAVDEVLHADVSEFRLPSLVLRAHILHDLGRNDEAQRSFREIERLAPDGPEVFLTALALDLPNEVHPWRGSASIARPASSSSNKSDLLESLQIGGIFPNPAADQTIVMISGARSQDVVISVFDLLGRQVLQPIRSILEGTERSVRLQTRELGAGTYVVRVSTLLSSASMRLVVAH